MPHRNGLTNGEAVAYCRRRIDDAIEAIRSLRNVIPSTSEARDAMARLAIQSFENAKRIDAMISRERFELVAAGLMQGGRLMIATSDLAVEMRPEDSDRAFNRFERWRESNRDLGMAMFVMASSADLNLIRE